MVIQKMAATLKCIVFRAQLLKFMVGQYCYLLFRIFLSYVT